MKRIVGIMLSLSAVSVFADVVVPMNLVDKKGVDACQVSYPARAAGVGVGSGWRAYPEVLKNRLGPRVVRIEAERYPRAAYIARLGVKGLKNNQAVSAELALPVYLRDTVARKMGS